MTRRVLEKDIEDYLGRCVASLGGAVRKVTWVGRRSAPDRLVMLPQPGRDRYGDMKSPAIWVEVKNPETIKTFPADERERAQHREHERMRKLGQTVVVVGTFEQVEDLLGVTPAGPGGHA